MVLTTSSLVVVGEFAVHDQIRVTSISQQLFSLLRDDSPRVDWLSDCVLRLDNTAARGPVVVSCRPVRQRCPGTCRMSEDMGATPSAPRRLLRDHALTSLSMVTAFTPCGTSGMCELICDVLNLEMRWRWRRRGVRRGGASEEADKEIEGQPLNLRRASKAGIHPIHYTLLGGEVRRLIYSHDFTTNALPQTLPSESDTRLNARLHAHIAHPSRLKPPIHLTQLTTNSTRNGNREEATDHMPRARHHHRKARRLNPRNTHAAQPHRILISSPIQRNHKRRRSGNIMDTELERAVH